MQYENEEPMYIDQFVNNNNETGKTYIFPMKSPMGVSRNVGSKLTKSASAKQLSYSTKNSNSPPRQYLYSKKLMSKQNANQKITRVEEVNLFADDIKGSVRSDIQKSINILGDIENSYKRVNYPTYEIEVSDIVQNEEYNTEDFMQPWNNTYRRVKAPQDAADSRTVSIYSSPLLESTDDESFKDARTNLKQLKKVLANRREHFFYGSDSSHTSADLSTYTFFIFT